MNKKIMMGLGAITAIAAPVVGLISCGDSDTPAAKIQSSISKNIVIKKAEVDSNDYKGEIQKMTKDKIISFSLSDTKTNSSKEKKALFWALKTFDKGIFDDNKDIFDDKDIAVGFEFKVKTAFAGNKIMFDVKASSTTKSDPIKDLKIVESSKEVTIEIEQ